MTKKLLYLANLNIEDSKGYGKKIFGQTAGFLKAGWEVDLLTKGNGGAILFKGGHPKCFTRLQPYLCLPALLTLYLHTILQVSANNYSLIYIRHPRSNPLYFLFLLFIRWRIRPKGQIISEFPTFPYDHELVNSSSIRDWIVLVSDLLTRYMMRFVVDCFVCVAYNGNVFGKQAITIENGVSPHRRHVMPDFNGRISIIGVGNISKRHAYDRIITGIKNYKERNVRTLETVSVEFHIVGRGEIGSLQKLVFENHLERHVFFHGEVYDKELDSLFDQCNVAAGNLGFHRVNVSASSALKEREYCARGIPFIMASPNQVMEPIRDKIFWVSPDDEPVKIEDLIKFMDEIRSNQHVCNELVDFAAVKFGWREQLTPVIEYMNSKTPSVERPKI